MIELKSILGSISRACILIFTGSLPAVSAVNDFDGAVSIKKPLEASIYQQLYFGKIAPSLTHTGTVKVRPGSNNKSKCNKKLTCFEKGNHARMLVTGEPFKIFTTSNPGPITLSDGQGATLLVDNWVGAGGNNNYWGSTAQLKKSGIRRQSFGATLHVGVNQPVGTYTGSYMVQVEYQ